MKVCGFGESLHMHACNFQVYTVGKNFYKRTTAVVSSLSSAIFMHYVLN